MSDLIVIQPQVTELTVTEDVNQVVVSSVGVQGAKGDTGATGSTGATGAQGPSGVIAVTAPITNSGTSTSANIGVSAGSTSTAGVLQLTDSTSSTSTTTAATPNAVKTAYDSLLTRLGIIPLRSGKYYANATYSGTIGITANTTYYMPFFVPNTITVDRMQFQTGSNFSGTASVRMGIYADSSGIPSTLIVDAGTVSATAGSTIYSITLSQSLTGGVNYWLAFNCQSAATSNTYIGAGASITSGQVGLNYMVSSTFQGQIAYTQSSVTGAFANAGTLVDSTTAYKIGLRIA